MAIIPISLEGDNLGIRHKHLNNLVNEAFKNHVPFESICDIPEQSAIDRLFKIDLATKYKNVDYIIKTLKDNDMLYVSRAMKCNWLITDDMYMNMISPANLEQRLYPDMRTNATNKMKHWIQICLKDENRCKDFYEYYKKDQINYALKFLPKCPIDFYIEEMDAIPTEKFKPQFLKLLCERSAKAAEIYFENSKEDSNKDYITKIQNLLKSDADVFFYIIEHFFLDNFNRLNKKATHYIVKHHRDRFDAKPELYTSRILDLSTIANMLKSEEIQELIIKLARADFLYNHPRHTYSPSKFDYEFAKPLIKAIDPKERSKFCTKIFTEKAFGEPVTEPPYLIPTKQVKDREEYATLDKDNENYDEALKDPPGRQYMCCMRSAAGCIGRFKTELDNLYDQYRFKSFEKTFAELRQRITKESNMNMRQNMMLVLISKTGGRTESVEALLKYLLEKHLNEPINLRAAIVRSFVKRSFAWRWPDTNWEMLLTIGHDLGLDGTTSEVECREGLHAVVLRYILANNDCPPAIWNTFINDILSLNEYKLKFFERRVLHERLPSLVISSVRTELNPEISIKRLTDVCDALDAYKIKIENYPGYMEAVTEFAQKHISLAKPLLLRLFKAGIGRKLLFRENFEIIQTDASYINALRHDPTLLSDKKFEDLLSNINDLHHCAFLRKIALYFGEEDGIASRYVKCLKIKAIEQPHVKLARPMALLTRAKTVTWPQLDAPEDKMKQQKYKKMVESLQNNSYLAWEKLPQQPDAKDISLAALATWIQTCSPNALIGRMGTLMAEPKHALLVLALRASKIPGSIAKTLTHAATYRPMRALCVTLCILRQSPQAFLTQDLEGLLSLVSVINLKGKSFKRYCDLARLNDIPKSFRATYSLALYQNLSRMGFGPEKNSKPQPYYRIAVPLVHCLANHVDELDSDVIKNILTEFLENVFTLKVIQQFDEHYQNQRARNELRGYIEAFMVLIARYIITSKSDEDVKKRIREVYEPFEQKLKALWHIEAVNSNSDYDFGYFGHFLLNVSLTRVFLRETDFSLPILDKLCCFGDEHAPLAENFALNYFIRFIRLFRASIKLSVNERPDLYKSGKVEGKKAVEFVILCFGKIIAVDVEDFVCRHFPSIRIFYTNALRMFLDKRNIRGHDYIIQGLFSDDSKPNAVIMGLSFYNHYYDERRHANEELRRNIANVIENAKTNEIKFYKEFSEMSDNVYQLV